MRRDGLSPVSEYGIVHQHNITLLFTSQMSNITPSILPACSPSFFPLIAIKCLFPQFLVDCIVRLTHPRAKLASAANSWGVLGHPALKVLGANPARVKLAKSRQEAFCFGLQLRRRIGRICCGNRVKKCPRGAPKSFNVGRAIGG